MKSVIGMIVVFIGVYIVVYYDIFGFFAQKWFFIFSMCSIAVTLLIAAVTLGLPFNRKRGGQNDKDIHLD